jgi:malonyl-CoA O-methyltransferase
MPSRDAQRRADAAAATFDAADFVHAHTREALLQRLAPMLVDAAMVVDLGTATGAAYRPLAGRFRGARIIGVDLARNMLRVARAKQRWLAKRRFIQADATRLPFADQSIDVVYANLLLPWIREPGALFAEINRVLRPGGLFAFSTLGPDSLAELRQAWQHADGLSRESPFPDMHDLGDAIVRSGLADPVLDADRLTVTYRDAKNLFADLSAVGARVSGPARRHGLVGRETRAALLDALDAYRAGELLRFELELVYGHCWGSGRSAGAGEFQISPTEIPRRRS